MFFALLARILAAVLFAGGCVMLASCLYLLTLALASFLHRSPDRTLLGRSRLTVLVPAHNEEEHLGRCLTSLAQQTYPARRREIVVIADNCSDGTVRVAEEHGSRVMVRQDADAPGKGHALRWALDQLLYDRESADVFVVVDADSTADPGLLGHLEAEIAAGAEVAQSDYRVLDAESGGSRLVATGFLLFHRVRLAGRAAVGLPANLVGNGMAFKREVLERVPWNAFSSVEDLEYSLILRLAGVRPAFVPNAMVFGPTPQSRRALHRQRTRWEGGRLFMLRTWTGPLLRGALRRRDWGLIDAALDLAILPTGLLVLMIGTGTLVTGLAIVLVSVPAWSVLPWLLSVAALPAYVLVGLRAANAPSAAYRALLSAPAFLVRKLFFYARLPREFRPGRWEDRTENDSDDLIDPDGDGIAWIAGVPVHVVDMGGAVKRVMDLVGRPDGGHVCTVNLDFVVSAQTDPVVTGVLQRSDLNVADGAPIAWLARLLGHHIPRVAGADLVPQIAGAAAEQGVPIFFLGGEHNAAEESARRLSARFPSLTVAGCYEPPRARLDQLPSAEMVDLIRRSGAAIVLVGLGHPKQEHWIAENRAGLGSSVAIGVGGCFDFITARRRRAPRWVQDSGLEWLFRLSQEPQRLSWRYARDAAWLFVLMARVIRSRRAMLPQSSTAI